MLFRNNYLGVRWLSGKNTAVSAKDMGSVLSSHSSSQLPVPLATGDLIPASSGTMYAHGTQTCMQAPTHTYKIIINLLKKK